MTNELTIPTNWAQLKEQATMLVQSGFLPPSIKTPAQAIAVAVAAKELGIGMMEGFRSINIIQGKPTISPQLMLALANRKGLIEDIKIDATEERCVVTIKRNGREPHTETFGRKEAAALGLIGKDNYKKQEATMYKWRALAANIRVTVPDVVLGFYTPEEMGAEVKIGEGEEMEVVSIPSNESVNIGKRVPKEYWDLRNTDPEKAQELLGGEGYWPQKTDKGYFIHTSKDNVLNLPEEKKENGVISHDEQLEIFRLAKEKNVSMAVLKNFLTEELKVAGTAQIPKDAYNKVYEFIIREGKASE